MPTSVFLSCVSNELRSYRTELANQLAAAGASSIHQEQFKDAPGRLLDFLDDHVQRSQWVVHLVGHGVGKGPEKDELEAFLKTRPNLLGKLGSWIDPDALRRLSYTQWEFWLGLYRDKRCLIYPIAEEAKREPNFVSSPDEQKAQETHLSRIRSLGWYRYRVSDKWELCTRVLVSLLDLSVEKQAEPPAIALGFRLTSQGHSSSGAIRWRGRTIRLADEMVLDVQDKQAVCDRLNDLIHRGNSAFIHEKLGIDKIVIELVLPEELLTRPLSDWTYYHDEMRALGKQPIRDYRPIRVRLSGREASHDSMTNIRARLELLARHEGSIAAVCRTVPAHEIGAANPRPLALIHDDQAEGCWHPTSVVCGAFAKPPPRVPRTLAGRLPKKMIQSEWFRALHAGVPFLVWSEEAIQAEIIEDHLKHILQPSRLCLYFERQPFVVLAESHEPPQSGPAPLFSDVSSSP